MTPEIMTAERMTAQAMAELGSDVAPTDFVVQGLCAAVDAFNLMPQSPVAELSFAANALRKLKNGIHLSSRLPHRDMADRVVTVITGLPRTGSTLLHNLLALEPGTGFLDHSRVINSWADTRAEAEADAAARLELMDLVSPAIRDLHPAQTYWPEECTVLFENSFASYQLPITYGLPGYFDWLQVEPMGPHYEMFAESILHMTSNDEPKQIVLKSPFHLLSLADLKQVFPRLTIVNTVRNPAEILPSWYRLVRSTAEVMAFETVFEADLWPRWLAILVEMASISVETAQEPGTLTVSYESLVSDPLAVVAAIVVAQGREFTLQHEQLAEAWLRQPEAMRRGTAYEAWTLSEVAASDRAHALSTYAALER